MLLPHVHVRHYVRIYVHSCTYVCACACMYALCMYVQIAFRPDVVGECNERFTMACDNCSVVDITVTGEETSCSPHMLSCLLLWMYVCTYVRMYVCTCVHMRGLPRVCVWRIRRLIHACKCRWHYMQILYFCSHTTPLCTYVRTCTCCSVVWNSVL